MAKDPKKRFCFVYRTTNLINNKYYIGCHCTYKLDDGYLGSGMRIQRSIAKYGRENFKLEILEYFETREQALIREKELVTEELLKDPMCLNLKLGGSGGFNRISALRGASARGKKTWSDPEFRKRHAIDQSVRTKKLHAQGKIRYDTWRGKKRSEEQKLHQSKVMQGKQSGSRNSQFGKSWIHSDIENRSIKVDRSEIDQYLNSGWILGRKMKP